MRRFVHFWLFLGIFFSIQFCVLAQNTQTIIDVLKLKQGGIVKGQIVKIIPNTSIRIKTLEGSIYEFNMDEVKSIDKDTIYTQSNDELNNIYKSGKIIVEEPSDSDPLINNSSTSLYFGLSVPLSDFADENNGLAKTGFALGLNYASRGDIGGLLNISYAFNGIDVQNRSVNSSGSWSSFWALGGLKIGTRNSSGNNFYCGPLLGFCISSSPSLEATSLVSTGSSYIYAKTAQESASAIALAYGGIVSVNINHFQLGLMYTYCEPEFEAGITASAAGYSSASDKLKFKQKITILQLTVGYHF
jgi:hypothetical protein